MLCGQKSYAPQAGYSGYEYELSIHLNTSYISFALVRVLRTGAFCFFQLFSEKRTQEPSPERVRSERGREDKPLTPVLYSTREGGELYGAIFQRPGFQAMLADIEAGKVGILMRNTAKNLMCWM